MQQSISRKSEIPPDLEFIPALAQPNGCAAFKVFDSDHLHGPPPSEPIREAARVEYRAPSLMDRLRAFRDYMNEPVYCPEIEQLGRTLSFATLGPLGPLLYDELRKS